MSATMTELDWQAAVKSGAGTHAEKPPGSSAARVSALNILRPAPLQFFNYWV